MYRTRSRDMLNVQNRDREIGRRTRKEPAMLPLNYLNPTSLLLGIAMGVSGFILFLKRMDRSGENGCFYTLMIGVVAVIAIVIALWINGL